MRFLWVVAAACALLSALGCGRLGFDAQLRDDGGSRAGGDSGAVDGSVVSGDSGILGWIDAAPACNSWGGFGPAQPVPVINDPAHNDWSPTLSADGRVLVFASFREGVLGGDDLFMATRADPSADFGTPTPLDELNTSALDGYPHLSPDGLTLWFRSSRAGGAGNRDIWVASRPDSSSPFEDVTNEMGVNTGSPESTPVVTADGRELFFAAARMGLGSYHPYRASRGSLSQPFQGDVEIDLGGSMSDNEWMGSVSPDSLDLYFAASRGSSFDIYVATRADRDSPFQPAVAVPGVNSDGDDVQPFLSRDGSTLYYVRNATAADTSYESASAGADIYYAVRDCQD